MKSFSERNLTVIGVIGVAATAAIVLGRIAVRQAADLHRAKAPVLRLLRRVQWARLRRAGAGLGLSGRRGDQRGTGRRRVCWSNSTSTRTIRLGDRTEAAIKAKSLLGVKVLEITPRGDGQLSGPIPLDRTTPAYELPDALGDLAQTHPRARHRSAQPVADDAGARRSKTPHRISRSRSRAWPDSRKRSTTATPSCANLLANASKVTSVLAQRSDQVVSLIRNTNALLAQLRTQSAALDQISGDISALSKQLSGFVADNRAQLRPALDKLNGVLTIVDNRKERVQKSIKLLNTYAMSLGESRVVGPVLQGLCPQPVARPIRAAVRRRRVLRSGPGPERVVALAAHRPADRPAGYPPAADAVSRAPARAAQPNRTLPDAITGNPGDQPCTGTGSGSGCYPYREPLPAPPPGGPPPGPPHRRRRGWRRRDPRRPRFTSPRPARCRGRATDRRPAGGAMRSRYARIGLALGLVLTLLGGIVVVAMVAAQDRQDSRRRLLRQQQRHFRRRRCASSSGSRWARSTRSSRSPSVPKSRSGSIANTRYPPTSRR